MQEVLIKYLKAFKKLRIDRAHGVAPHKPILLLSILQSILQKQITENHFFITAELVALFKTNWNNLVHSSHDCRFALPFYHLTSDKFWKLVPKQGFENILQLRSSMRSFSNLNTCVAYASVDDDLWQLMNRPESNQTLQQFLLDEYFPGSKNSFDPSIDKIYPLLDSINQSILQENADVYRREIKQLIQKKDDEAIFLRGAVFKREIPKIYNGTCCISGLKIDALPNITMVDACHIVPFSVSYDDTITNGLSLCPNLHRAFDRGLLTIDDNYRVIVSNNFLEKENIYSLRTFEGQTINLPNKIEYYPSVSNLDWHRSNIFR